MKIGLCSSYVPFVEGGARNIVDWLEIMLVKAGHQVEKVYLPDTSSPELLFKQFFSYRWIDLTEQMDRIICLRPPAHMIPHPHKILWFLHHIRMFYDLWDSEYCTFPINEKNLAIRQSLHAYDTAAMQEAKKVFTISQVVSDRLMRYNNIKSEVLYFPLLQPENFTCRDFNHEIVCIARIVPHKRQHLLIESLQYVQTPVKLRLCGMGFENDYETRLHQLIDRLGLHSKVIFENRWISEKEKIELLSNCLATAYLPIDEDAYGYTSLETSHAGKPILTTTDSGGVTELVKNEFNGFVTSPEPRAIAFAMDRLFREKDNTRKMGENAKLQLDLLNISWEHVLDRLLA